MPPSSWITGVATIPGIMNFLACHTLGDNNILLYKPHVNCKTAKLSGVWVYAPHLYNSGPSAAEIAGWKEL